MADLLANFDETKFHDYLMRQGIKESSAKTYMYSLKEYLRYMEQFSSLNEEEFFQKTFEFVNSKARSWQTRFAIKFFFFYLGKKDLYDRFHWQFRRKFRMVGRKIAFKHLSFSQIDAMMKNLKVPYKLFLMVQYETACRFSDVRALRVGDFGLDENGQPFIKILIKKSGDVNSYYISSETAFILAQYIKLKAFDKKDILFPISKESYNEALKSCAKKLGYENWHDISSHWIRSSRAYHLRELGYKPETIQKILGHANLMTTFRYIEEAGEDSKEIIKKNPVRW